MRTNVKVLGWLHIILGIVGLFIGCWIAMLMMSVGLFARDHEALGFLSIIGSFVMGLMLLLAGPSVIVGIGLLQYRPWARVLALALGLFNLFMFPYGTIFGVYTFVSLLNSEAAALFTK